MSRLSAQDLPAVADALLQSGRRALILGATGTGKSSLAEGLARQLRKLGRGCTCLAADPGLPGFGPPGALCLGVWANDTWNLIGLEALCTLDAGRFRLPLAMAAGRLAARPEATGGDVLLVDMPGVVRGVAGSELLAGLCAAVQPDVLLALAGEGSDLPLRPALALTGLPALALTPAPGARPMGGAGRARRRTRRWDTYLEAASTFSLSLDGLALGGTPPPSGAEEQWRGRQIGLLGKDGATLGLGEVREADSRQLSIRAAIEPSTSRRVGSVVVRDARRSAGGRLETASPPRGAVRFVPPTDLLPREALPSDPGNPKPMVRVGRVDAVLANGVLGDPLLHVRLQQQPRSLLLDLGDAGRLPARLAHQVSDVFLSHAHFDHIGGFLWLLRSQITSPATCRVFGPPGTAFRIQSFADGVLWDRIGDRGPRFRVTELSEEGGREGFLVQCGLPGPRALGSIDGSGPLLDEPDLRVEAVALDHGTTVLAYALVQPSRFSIEADALRSLGYAPGPWIRELKCALATQSPERWVHLPDGGERTAGELAQDLVTATAPTRLVYATDLADTPSNRRRLVDLARNAHTLFCEAPFAADQGEQARRTGHLTARACGEIALEAAVGQLVPFHFSRRYQSDPSVIYREVEAVFPRVAVPPESLTGRG